MAYGSLIFGSVARAASASTVGEGLLRGREERKCSQERRAMRDDRLKKS
jgi:hypothetical protein